MKVNNYWVLVCTEPSYLVYGVFTSREAAEQCLNDTFTQYDKEHLEPAIVDCAMIVCEVHGSTPRIYYDECAECTLGGESA